jgi:putative hydrolase of the HAD superfamily
MASIEAVIFDLGRVLVAIDNSLLVERLFKGLDTDDLQELGRRTMADPAMVDFNSGRIGPQTFYERMYRNWRWDMPFDEFKQLWCRIFYPMDGMESLIMQLCGKVKLGLLSDTDPLHWNHIRTTWPWIQQFQKPTLSFEVGVMKPDPAIYRIAAQNVNTAAEHCLYIDDLESNVAGARAVGMTAVRFDNVKQLKGVFTQYNLLDHPPVWK